MLLVIDVGNTNIVLGCIDNDKIKFTARMSTDRKQTADQYAVQIKNIIELHRVNPKDVNGSIISSVVPPVLNALKGAVRLSMGVESIIVGPGVKTGLNILMDNPAQVGSDLIVNAVGAIREYKPPIVIFDMGTATTISAIDKNKNYIGGSILPGVKISLDALSSTAAQLPAINLDEPKRIIGKNTIECMRSGVILGNAAMVDGMIDRFEQELGEKATVVATGGISRFIVAHCRHQIIYDGDLLLKGLNILYKKNRN